MPQRKSGVKALRKSQKKHSHNLDLKTDLKKTIKKFLACVNEKNKADAQTALNILFKKIDKAAKRNTLSKNTANRRKSYYSKLLSKLA
ncbi:MAG: 30S ribosomal protein S20 [Candidatus Omnitrophota bacterium]